MTPKRKTKKVIIKISRHPFIMPRDRINYQEVKVRKCRVNLERLKDQQATEIHPFPLLPKPKRCCVRVARLPDLERSEISITPASSIVCSDFDDNSKIE